MRVEWTPEAEDSLDRVALYLTEEAGFSWAETKAITDNIEDFVASLPRNPVLQADRTYREISVAKSKRFKVLYRLIDNSDVIEILLVRSTSQNTDAKTIAAEYEAGQR
jgi:plasmid stabilization system protein ParE